MSTKTNPTHTPGPWTSYGDQAPQRIVDTRSRDVATVHCSLPVWEANARLIAAAPEMLEALRWAYTCLPSEPGEEPTGPLADQIRAAIAKATGTQS